MRYSILGFNQEYVVKLQKEQDGRVKKLDTTDLLILKDVADFMNRSKIIKYTIEDKVYFSIQYATILEDLPILDIKKQALSDRLDKMVFLDVLEKIVVKNQSGTFVAFRMGVEYEKLLYSRTNSETLPTSSELQVQRYSTTTHNTNITNTNIKEINDNNIEEWRKDFNAYLEIVNKAKLELLSDTNFKADKEKYYPNLDYELSIEKIVKEYWGTEQGWEKRRKGKSKSLDMVRTLKKAFDYATNRVYKRMQPQQGIATTQQKQSAPKPFNYTRAPLHPMLRFINEKGVLNDGTFIEDGYRYYISPTSGQKYSIPCNASKRPSDKHDFDNLTKMWYIKEQEENSIFNDIW